MQMLLVNPRIDVMDKLIVMGTIDKIGKDAVYLSTDDALHACKFLIHQGSPETQDLMEVAL